MAAVDEFTVTVKGKGAHAAMPQAGVDPVVCLAHMVTALQTIASRSVDPFQQVVVSVTQLRAGTAFNIIPETAWMNGTIRALRSARCGRACRGCSSASCRASRRRYGCEATVLYERGNQPTVNDPAMCRFAREAATGGRGRGRVA